MESTKTYLLSNEDLAWFAGIIDGEGCIGLYRRTSKIKLKNGSTKNLICPGPYLTVTNTNHKLIEKCRTILTSLGVKYYFMIGNKNENRKFAKRIRVTSYSEIKKTLLAIKPYIIGKIEQVEILLQFLSLYKKQDEISYNLRRELLEKIQFENKHGSLIPRDYTR